MDEKQFNKDTEFIALHYSEHAFVPDMHFGKKAYNPRIRRIIRWSAAAAVAIVLTAGAATVYHIKSVGMEESTPIVEQQITIPAEQRAVEADSVRTISFTNAPLSTVIEEAEKVYDVRLENLPVTDNRITISYKGSAADFVKSINDLLGSEIIIAGESAASPSTTTESKHTK